MCYICIYNLCIIYIIHIIYIVYYIFTKSTPLGERKSYVRKAPGFIVDMSIAMTRTPKPQTHGKMAVFLEGPSLDVDSM